jgi:hypothetical protein
MKDWRKKEKKDAKDFEARRMPRSGGLWFAKGDSRSDKFLIETKMTGHKSFGITERIWGKLAREALLSQRMPILSIKFGGGIELVILDKNDFITLSFEKND